MLIPPSEANTWIQGCQGNRPGREAPVPPALPSMPRMPMFHDNERQSEGTEGEAPEAAPGPHDASALFDEFLTEITNRTGRPK